MQEKHEQMEQAKPFKLKVTDKAEQVQLKIKAKISKCAEFITLNVVVSQSSLKLQIWKTVMSVCNVLSFFFYLNFMTIPDF